LREVALGFSTQEMAAAFKDKEKTGCATMSCSMWSTEDHRGGVGFAGPGHHLRRCLPVLEVRRGLPWRPFGRVGAWAALPVPAAGHRQRACRKHPPGGL